MPVSRVSLPCSHYAITKAERYNKGAEMFSGDWPEGKLFLVVSEEFAELLSRPSRAWLTGHPPHCHYSDPVARGTTRIFEVKKGVKH